MSYILNKMQKGNFQSVGMDLSMVIAMDMGYLEKLYKNN